MNFPRLDAVTTAIVSECPSPPPFLRNSEQYPAPRILPNATQCPKHNTPPPSLELIKMLQPRQHHLLTRLLDLPSQKHLIQNGIDLSSSPPQVSHQPSLPINPPSPTLFSLQHASPPPYLPTKQINKPARIARTL